LFGKARHYTHGEYYIDSDGLINGFAFRQQDTSPVGLLIVQNSQVQAEVDAKEFFEVASWLTLPRRGYVGFRCSLKRLLKSDAEVSVLVKETEQPLLKRSAPFDRSRSV